MKKVCHITNMHPRYDVRIFRKECTSLAERYDVTLLVVDNMPEETKNNVTIKPITGLKGNRFSRLFTSISKIKKAAMDIDADIYHLHDPGLLLIALYLKKNGKIVIYDSHENTVGSILEKGWIPKPFRHLISYIYKKYEKHVLSKISTVVSVTPALIDIFKKINSNTVQITNYPIIEPLPQKYAEKETDGYNSVFSICFIGGVKPMWMVDKIENAINDINNIKFILAGPASPDYLNILKGSESWNKTEYLGVLDFDDTVEVRNSSNAGMALCDYSLNTFNKQGSIGNTKIFEYMMAGLPVICTDFDLWVEIVENENCGICVNPHDIDAIRNAIIKLQDDPKLSVQLGENGRKAVEEKYNWDTQAQILMQLYSDLLEHDNPALR